MERFKISLRIEVDPALRQHDRIVYIDVPRGALPKRTSWDAIVTCVHQWLITNLANIGEGHGFQDCPIQGAGIKVPFFMQLDIRIVPSKGSDLGPLIRRYCPTDVPGSVEKAPRLSSRTRE